MNVEAGADLFRVSFSLCPAGASTLFSQRDPRSSQLFGKCLPLLLRSSRQLWLTWAVTSREMRLVYVPASHPPRDQNRRHLARWEHYGASEGDRFTNCTLTSQMCLIFGNILWGRVASSHSVPLSLLRLCFPKRETIKNNKRFSSANQRGIN